MNQEKEVLNLEEAGALLGISTKTLIKALREEDLPARKIGREWRFSRTALLAWLGEGRSRAYSLSENDVKDYFNQVAPDWEKIRTGYFGESLRDAALGQVKLGPGAVVADVGMGTGFMTEGLLKAGAKVIGVDNSPAMLKEAADRFRWAGDRLELREGSVQSLPVETGTLDGVFGNMILHHAPEPAVAVKEFARVLKPGGKLVITDMDEHNHAWMLEEMADLWPGFDRADVKTWFEAAGLKDVSVDCSGSNCCATSCGNSGTKADVGVFLAVGTR